MGSTDKELNDGLLESQESEHLREELRRTREFLDAIIEQNPFPVWISDADGWLQRSNPALRKLLNVTEEQIVNKYNPLRDPLVKAAGLYEKFKAVYEKGEIAHFELYWDGRAYVELDIPASKPVFIEGTLFPVIDKNGKITNVVMVYEEISERKKDQQELIESKKLLEAVIKQAPFGAHVLKGDLNNIRLVIENDESVRILKTSVFEEHTIDSADNKAFPVKFFTPDGKTQIPLADMPGVKAFEGKKSTNEEYLFRYNDGKEIFITASASPIYDDKGNFLASVVTFQDITKQKKAQKEIIESKKLLEAVIQQAPFAASILKGDYNNTLAVMENNEAIRIMRGNFVDQQTVDLNSENPFGMTFFKPDGKTEVPLSELPGPQAFLGKKISNKVYIFKYPNGDSIFARVSGSPVYDDEGNFIAAVVTFEDITKQHIARQELAKAKSYIDNILNSMPSILVGVNRDYEITHWNNRATELTSISPETAIGHKLYEIMPQLAGDLDTIKEAINERISKTNVDIIRERNHRRVHENVTVYPLTSNGVEGAVIRIDDVTHQKELEQQLAQSRKMDAIGKLAGGIAHDFNNMLSGILGATEMLADSVENKDDKHLLNLIMQSSERAAELTSKLLAFSRQEQIENVPVDVHANIHAAVDILKLSLDKSINVELQLDADSTSIIGDESLLQNAFLNIALNAGQAMPQGGKLTIKTQKVKLDENSCTSNPFDISPGDYIEIEFRDNGCGISEESLSRIFEPFYTTKGKNKGTGLGLAAVYGTIQDHKGTITVESEINSGTAFHIYLPLVQKEAETKSHHEKAVTGSGCILVVDDEPFVSAALKAMLTSLNYRVLLADNGLEAVDIYRSHQNEIDLVLLDMIMPEINGRETFRKLQNINKDVKVIISSGYAHDEDISDLKTSGLCGFIRKPYRRTVLSKIVAEALNRK